MHGWTETSKTAGKENFDFNRRETYENNNKSFRKISKSIETCLILRIQVTLTTQHIQIRLKFRKCLQFGKFDPYFRSALHIFSKLY